MTRILIVDDHHAARTTLRELLDWHSFQVCGDAQNGKEAIEKVIELNPEIVLMDINMPVLNGIDAAHQLRKMLPSAKLIFVTMHSDADFVTEAFRAGAAGYILKRSAASELLTAIREVLGYA